MQHHYEKLSTFALLSAFHNWKTRLMKNIRKMRICLSVNKWKSEVLQALHCQSNLGFKQGFRFNSNSIQQLLSLATPKPLHMLAQSTMALHTAQNIKLIMCLDNEKCIPDSSIPSARYDTRLYGSFSFCIDFLHVWVGVVTLY